MCVGVGVGGKQVQLARRMAGEGEREGGIVEFSTRTVGMCGVGVCG